jgi:FixJ family two-component response regulator
MEEQAADNHPMSAGNVATVYVVDDDDSVRRSLKRLFRSKGWNVETFAKAADLLERVPLIGPGCILLDVQMPGINGLELQERLAEEGIYLPVVFLSGKGNIPMSVRAMKHGAVDFLVKPVAEDVLFNALDQAIQRHVAETGTRHNRESIMARLARLSEREREVLERVLHGRLNKQIAFDLGIAEKTVKVHRGRVMEKMEAGSLADLVHMCDAAGIEFLQSVS